MQMSSQISQRELDGKLVFTCDYSGRPTTKDDVIRINLLPIHG